MIKYKLNQLNFTDLKAVRDFVNDGTYDGYSTENLEVEACGFGYYYERKHERYKERKKLLALINSVIDDKLVYLNIK